jgi:hypothetical protein
LEIFYLSTTYNPDNTAVILWHEGHNTVSNTVKAVLSGALVCSVAEAFMFGSKHWSRAPRGDAAHWRWEFLFGEFTDPRSLRM